ncbi:hypothetical protein KXW64_008464, partial [Aspergillus fumigatus]
RGRQARRRAHRDGPREGAGERGQSGGREGACQEPRPAVRRGAGRAHPTCRRSAAPGADPDQLRQQRGQVHRAWRSRHPGAQGVGDTDRGRSAAGGARHRHRPQRRAGAEALPELPAGRQLHHPQIRRHRARAGHQQAPGRPDGRRGRGAQR